MHPATLPGLMIALAAGMFGGIYSHTASFPSLFNLSNLDNFSSPGHVTRSIITFSIAAQTTPTLVVTPTSAPALTATVTTAVSGTVTATVVVTASPTITGLSTPVPLPTVAPPSGLTNPFDPAFLFSAPPPDSPRFGPLAWAFLVVMAGLLAASLYFYLVKRVDWKRTNPVWSRAANRWGQVGMWVAGIGLILLFFRAISLDFFNMRFWLYLWALVTLVAAGWFLYWWRTTYPREMARYMKAQRVRQYMPGTARSAARQNARTTATGRAASEPARSETRPARPARPAPADQSRQKGRKKRKKR